MGVGSSRPTRGRTAELWHTDLRCASHEEAAGPRPQGLGPRDSHSALCGRCGCQRSTAEVDLHAARKGGALLSVKVRTAEAERGRLTAKTEEWVFHGTSLETARNIMQEGFLVGGVDTSAITGRAVPVTNRRDWPAGRLLPRRPL